MHVGDKPEAGEGGEAVMASLIKYKGRSVNGKTHTELEETFPSHVVCAWIGTSYQVAKKHYLQITNEHFAKASAPA